VPSLGIFGGSFDPIHCGHLGAVAAVLAARPLERILLLPASRPPHKSSGCVAPFADRVAMARIAVEGLPRIEVSTLEGERTGPSYTIDTVEELERREPGARIELLVGADMLLDLPRWRRAEELARRVTVVAFARPGQDLAAARAAFAPLGEPVFVEIPARDVSATEVRRRLSAGEPVGGLLPPAVEGYIRRRGLYGAARVSG